MSVIGEMSNDNAESLIGTVAFSLNDVANANSPVVEGELGLDGSRFEGLLPPTVSTPVFAIRKRARQIFDLDDYVSKDIVTETQRVHLIEAIRARRNILIPGATGRGKTTFANALIDCIAEGCSDDRLVIIEDTAEIQCKLENAVILHTTPELNM